MVAESLVCPHRAHSRFDSDELAFRPALTNTAMVRIAALVDVLAVPELELAVPIAMKTPKEVVLVVMEAAPSVLVRAEPVVPARAVRPAQPAHLEVPSPEALVPLSTELLLRQRVLGPTMLTSRTTLRVLCANYQEVPECLTDFAGHLCTRLVRRTTP